MCLFGVTSCRPTVSHLQSVLAEVDSLPVHVPAVDGLKVSLSDALQWTKEAIAVQVQWQFIGIHYCCGYICAKKRCHGASCNSASFILCHKLITCFDKPNNGQRR